MKRNKNRHTIIVRLSRQRYEALRDVSAWLMNNYEVDGDGDALDLLHIMDMTSRLTDMLEYQFENANMMLTAPEAFAFCKVWNMVELPKELVYVKVVILDLIRDIDKDFKSPDMKIKLLTT